jgi:CHAT domain-containing protein
VSEAFASAEVLAGDQATREAFVRASAGADVIHVATHGLFREDDPQFSALRLADGWMSLYDLYELRTRAALVCLSACQSGRSWVGGGDELIGLARGFLHAGASSLIVSLWPVQDASTADLMSDLHSRHQAGAVPAAALSESMLALRETHPHPYHWAPFVCIG